MSLELIRPHFEAVALEQGFQKHADGFATDNIAASKFNRAFHVEAFEFSGLGQNQTVLDVEGRVVVRLFFKGFRDVDLAIKQATMAGETYFMQALDGATRLGAEIKNTQLNVMVIEPYATTNDNFVVCRLEFSVLVLKAIC